MDRQLLHEIMSDARALYRGIVADEPAAATRATWSSCLSYSWERHPRRYAERIRSEWNHTAPAEQLETARKMASAAIRVYECKNGAFLTSTTVEPDDIASEAWALMRAKLDTLELVQQKRNRSGKPPLALNVLFFRAASCAVKKHLGNLLRNSGDDLNSSGYETQQSPEDTERSALLLDALNSIEDATQRTVLELLIQGETVRSIAEITGKSKTGVQRMIESIRAQLRKKIA